MTRTFFCRLALPLCGLLFSGHLFAAEGDKPLLQEGKKTLYQRILTTPGCKPVSYTHLTLPTILLV